VLTSLASSLLQWPEFVSKNAAVVALVQAYVSLSAVGAVLRALGFAALTAAGEALAAGFFEIFPTFVVPMGRLQHFPDLVARD